MEYRQYRNYFWKYDDDEIPCWKISEEKNDSYCSVWTFNAMLHSLDDAIDKIIEDKFNN